jgi:hypothetical protein
MLVLDNADGVEKFVPNPNGGYCGFGQVILSGLEANFQ